MSRFEWVVTVLVVLAMGGFIFFGCAALTHNVDFAIDIGSAAVFFTTVIIVVIEACARKFVETLLTVSGKG